MAMSASSSTQRNIAFVAFASLAVSAQEPPPGCTITILGCATQPEWDGVQFRDYEGEDYHFARDSEPACFKRAEDWNNMCENDPAHGLLVGASHVYNTQMYNPAACDKGWSLFGKHCFKHFADPPLNWFDAEAMCRDYGGGSHLASIHSKAENEFVFALTRGLSAWIGYQDVDQDTHYQWTDNTDNDFTNLAKNCTETPDDPECAPQETAQQWYTDFMGSEPASYVCKMPAKVPTDVLANVTAGGLVHLMQTGTLYQVMQDRFEEKPSNKAIEPMSGAAGDAKAKEAKGEAEEASKKGRPGLKPIS